MPQTDLLPVTLAAFKDHLTDGSTALSADDDAELTRALLAATYAIEKRVGPLVIRSFTEDVQATGPTWHQDTRRGKLLLNQRPAVAVTEVSLLLFGQVTALDGFDPDAVYLDQEAGILDLYGWTTRCDAYRVTYTAGRGSTPADVDDPGDIEADFVEAVLIVGEQLWETQRGRGLHPSRWGTQADPDASPEIMRGFALPRRALELIARDEQIVFG